MEKLENENKLEEVLDPASKPHRQSPEIDAQESQPEPVLRWKRLTHWLKVSTFTPEWLPSPLNHPSIMRRWHIKMLYWSQDSSNYLLNKMGLSS